VKILHHMKSCINEYKFQVKSKWIHFAIYSFKSSIKCFTFNLYTYTMISKYKINKNQTKPTTIHLFKYRYKLHEPILKNFDNW